MRNQNTESTEPLKADLILAAGLCLQVWKNSDGQPESYSSVLKSCNLRRRKKIALFHVKQFIKFMNQITNYKTKA